MSEIDQLMCLLLLLPWCFAPMEHVQIYHVQKVGLCVCANMVSSGIHKYSDPCVLYCLMFCFLPSPSLPSPSLPSPSLPSPAAEHEFDSHMLAVFFVVVVVF